MCGFARHTACGQLVKSWTSATCTVHQIVLQEHAAVMLPVRAPLRPSLSYQGPFTGEAVASFVVEEARELAVQPHTKEQRRKHKVAGAPLPPSRIAKSVPATLWQEKDCEN